MKENDDEKRDGYYNRHARRDHLSGGEFLYFWSAVLAALIFAQLFPK